MEIVFTRAPFKLKRTRISAHTVAGLAGSVDYLNNPSRPFADIVSIHVRESYQGLGIGRALIRELAADLGSGRRIGALIVHDPTLDCLGALNPRLDAYVNLPYTFSDREVLSPVPIVRLFESGGIHIVRIRVNYNSQSRRLETRNSVNRSTLRGIVL